MIAGFLEFEFNLPEALLASLVGGFDNLQGAPLTEENVGKLPEAQGVYQLLHADRVVYIGKTDAEQGLRQRLDRHAWTIQHRRNLDPVEVFFKAVRVFVFTAVDLETQLLSHYGRSYKVSWNKSGFGSNDPGRERDTTKLKADGFDAQFPIDLDRPIHVRAAHPVTAAQLLDALRAAVPYIVRAQTRPNNPRKAHSDLDVEVNFESGLTTARELVTAVVSALPTGWQATLLPGRVILYQENRTYKFGSLIASS